MMKFYYEAFTTGGKPCKGELEALNEAQAAEMIRNDKGLIAREISTQPIQMKYDHSKSKEGQEEDDDGSLRLNPTPAPDAPKGDMSPKFGAWNERLKDDLNRITMVARQMGRWYDDYDKCMKSGNDLPAGCPDMGGASWKAFSSFKMKIVADMIQKAMEKAAKI